LSVQQTQPVVAVAVAVSAEGSPTSALPDDGLLRAWPAVAVDVGKHHGYAFQWFSLSALIVGLTLWFQFLRPRLRPGLRGSAPSRPAE
jgi:cytochrome oxidase assembly protein ShyY1